MNIYRCDVCYDIVDIEPGPYSSVRCARCASLKPYRFVVTVMAKDEDMAEQVLLERLGPDEDYGFDYYVWYELQR